MTTRKLKCLTLLEKSKILEELDKKVTLTFLSHKYGVAKSTICGIKNKKKEILRAVSETFSGPGNRRTLKCGAEPLMEQHLYRWFLEQRKNQVVVTGMMIKDHAKYLHKKLNGGHSEFVASDGWLHKFKRRYGIRLLQVTGEKTEPQAAALPESASSKQQLRVKLEELGLCNDQVYNLDETSLSWKLLPDQTYLTTTEKNAHGKNKPRIAFLTCTNATGRHKFKPLVIGKSKDLQHFNNFPCAIDCLDSSTACLTASLLKEWFHKTFVPQVQTFLKDQNLPSKALLLLDNTFVTLERNLMSEDGDISILYVPSNIAPLPIDQNVIRVTKLFYRKPILSSMVAEDSEAIKRISLREAVANLAVMWCGLEEDTIKRCWDRFLDEEVSYRDGQPPSDEIVLTATNITDLQPNNTQGTSHEAVANGVNLPVEVLIKEEIEDDAEVVEEKSVVTHGQAAEAFTTAILWCEQQAVDYSNILLLRKLRDNAVDLSSKENS